MKRWYSLIYRVCTCHDCFFPLNCDKVRLETDDAVRDRLSTLVFTASCDFAWLREDDTIQRYPAQ